MSNFLLGVVGAAIGSAFGMPALGFALGSGVGSALGSHHHSAAPSIPGQRLQDLKVQTATYGIGIPQVYGRYRLGGNILWAKDILEVKDAQGAYHYYGHFALGLCRGPIAGIGRLWADGKEIFKMPFLGEGIREHYPPGVRFYPGDDLQLPDPLIQALLGKGHVPAFRGLAYVVFENLPLASFNNRLPALQVEVVQAIEERPPLPAEIAQKRYLEEKRGVQRGVRYPLRKEQSQNPVPPSLPTKAPAPLALAEVVTHLCSQAGFTPEQVDTHLLRDSLLGFVVMPTSARDALAGLMQVYGFDMVENGPHLVCIPRGKGAILSVGDADLAREEGTEAASALFTCLPALECPHQVSGVFNEPQQYRMITQTAAHSDGQRSERVELPLVLQPEEAALRVESLLESMWDQRLQYSFSLSRAYARLLPGDRLQWQDHTLRIIRVAYGSPGLVQLDAVEEKSEGCPASAEAGKIS